ncbi:hypothetical protein [Microbispora rosea]|uniref:hypothetical protein n=1 Tax=Microbispora rosea TaxID=58117 RepID=UPI0037BD08AB
MLRLVPREDDDDDRRLALLEQMYPAWHLARLKWGFFATRRVDQLTEEQKSAGLIAALGRQTAEELRDALGEQLLLEQGYHCPLGDDELLALLQRMAGGSPVQECCQEAALAWAWGILTRPGDIRITEDGKVVVVPLLEPGEWHLRALYLRAGGKWRSVP